MDISILGIVYASTHKRETFVGSNLQSIWLLFIEKALNCILILGSFIAYNHNWILSDHLVLYKTLRVQCNVKTLRKHKNKTSHILFISARTHTFFTLCMFLVYHFLQVDLYTGALFIQQTLGWGLYTSIALLLLITVFFTTLGQ